MGKQLLFKVFLLIIICVIVFLPFYFLISTNSNNSYFYNGEADLSAYNFDDEEIIDLYGEWEFFWQKHYTYEDFYSGNIDSGVMVNAPSVWNEYEIDGNRLSGFGFGTYRIKVKGIPKDTKLSIRIADEATAYSLYIDNILLISNGVAGTAKENTYSAMETKKANFSIPDEEFNIILHISNFVHNKGGMGRPL